MTDRVTVGKYLLEAIKNFGVKRIFGIPGDMVITFFKLIEDDPDIELCTLSHEPGVGFAAIGEARATQKPAVTCITYGAGGLNMLNAVACAYAEKTPVVVISGGPSMKERKKDVFLHHMVRDFDSQLKVFTEVTKEAVLIDDPKTAVAQIDRVLTACREYLLPVYIEVPLDIVDQEILVTQHTPRFRFEFDEVALKEATDEILQKVAVSDKPVIILGIEVVHFNLQNQVLTLAKKLNVPVVSTLLARDLVPDEDSRYFGTYLGNAGNPVAKKLVEESNCLLLLGVILSDINLGIKLAKTKRESLIHCVSRTVKTVNRVYESVPLRNLVKELLSKDMAKKSYVFPEKLQLQINRTCKYTDKFTTTAEVVDAVNWLFSEHGEMPVISDTGNPLFATIKIKTKTVIASAYYSSMGFAIPAAIGYAIATKKRPLILVGDGSFQMTGQEICHCPRYGINPIFIVFNNARWGMEQIFLPSAHFNELVNWPYAKMAELWGGKGYYCDTCDKLYHALEDAVNQQVFTLIEAVTTKEELPQEVTIWIDEVKRAKQ